MTAYNVSSYFLAQTLERAPQVVRKFTIGDSDYSARVIKWPKIKRKWNDIRPTSLTIGLINEDMAMNFLRNDPTALRSACKVQLGFPHPGENLLTRSEAFDVDSWAQTDVGSMNPDSEVAPNLVTTAEAVVFDNVESASLLQDISGTLAASTEYTFSAYVKLIDTAVSSDLQVQLVFGGDTLEIGDDITSGWQRFSLSHTSSSTPGGELVGFRTDSYTGALGFWGAQVNVGDSAGEYIRADDTTVSSGSNELVTYFSGTMDRAKFRRGQVDLSLQDKLKPFAELVLGSSDVPLDFTGSDYLVSDLVWYLVTSHGGLSAVESTSNPDIDYGSFLDWAFVFSNDNVLVNAYYEGKKVNDALRSIGRYTGSAIYVENDLLTFARFTAANSHVTMLSDELLELDLVVDDEAIINTQHVYGDYDTNSQFWKIDAVSVSTASVDSFGAREFIEKDETVWYVDSASSLNFAERQTLIHATPFAQFEAQTTLAAVARQLGESVNIVDSFHAEQGDVIYRLMGYELDIDRGQMKLEIDRSQSLQGFILDDPVYGLLDQAYNFLL